MNDKKNKLGNLPEMENKKDQKILENLLEEVSNRKNRETDTIVERVLDEVLAIDGKVRLEGILQTPKSRILYRNSIKEALNETYGYDLPMHLTDKEDMISELKRVLDKEEGDAE